MKLKRVVYLFVLAIAFTACIFSSVSAQTLRRSSTSTEAVSRMQIPLPKTPDLIVESIKFPGQLKEGDKVENIVVKVRNQGNGASVASKLNIFCKPAGPDSLNDKTYPLPQILVGSAETFTIPSGPNEVWKAGVFKISAVVDAQNSVQESNENNNGNSVEVSVAAAAKAVTAAAVGVKEVNKNLIMQPVKITSIRGSVKGAVAGKSVADYFGGCDKIILQVEKTNHEKAEPITCKTAPGQNYCIFNQILADPHYYNVVPPNPPGYIAKWDYKCNFPGSDKDRICDLTLKDVASVELIKSTSKFEAAGAGIVANGPNLAVDHISLRIPGQAWDKPYIVGMTVEVNYTIINKGNQPSPATNIRIDLAKNTSGFPTSIAGALIPIPALAINQKHEGQSNAIVTNCDTDGVKIVIDPDNTIQETKKDDNSLFQSFGGYTQSGSVCFPDQAAYQKSLLPDLGLDFVHFDNNYLQQGKVDLVFTVDDWNKYHSPNPFPKTKVVIYTMGQKVGEIDVKEAGDYCIYAVTPQPQCGQPYTITVDPDNLVNEKDESNNSKTKAYVCKF